LPCNESDEDIDVAQEGHGNSSRSALTASSVTTVCRSPPGSSGIPLRARGGPRLPQGAARYIGDDRANAPMLLLSDRPGGDQHIIVDRQCGANACS
jgi:hypothetical protein